MGGSATYQDVKPKTGTGRGWNFHPSTPKPVTSTFTANTCPACGAITIAGIYGETGRRVDLEPTPLTDHDEVDAIRDGVATYNLHDDLQIMRRFITEVRYATIVDRHARHTCGKTYGHGTSTRTVLRPVRQPDEPPF